MPVDCRDDRLAHLIWPQPWPAIIVGSHRKKSTLTIAEVGSGTKGFSGAGDDDGNNLVVTVGVTKVGL